MAERVFNIVIADDDLDDQELVRSAFKDSNAEVNVYAVFDGIQLMDLLLKRYKFAHNFPTPDVIFLDLNMPLMDGFGVLAEIRKNPLLLKIPVYVVTTSTTKSDHSRALKLGAQGFYSKGASSKDIQRIVKEICFDCFA